MFEDILFFTSNGTNAKIDDDYSGFTVELSGNSIIRIPNTATKCYVSLVSLTFWNSFLNIATIFSNNIFTYSIGAGVPSWQTLTIPNGNYSLTDLQNMIRNLLAPLIAGFLDSDLVFTPEYSTNKVLITTKKIKIKWDVYSPYVIMGFNINDITDISNFPTTASKIADFGSNHAIQIHSSMATSSYNGYGSDVLNMIGITSKPGSNQYSEITNLIRCNASQMIGSPVSKLYFYITNQDGHRFLTNDGFSMSIKVEYE